MSAALGAQALLEVWERGAGLHPLDRALTILHVANGQHSYADLAALPIGQRDAWLYAARTHMFGTRLQSVATCPRCEGKLEFELDGATIWKPQPLPQVAEPLHFATDEWVITFRLPNSLDLAAISNANMVGAARAALAQRCVQGATEGGVSVPVELLPEHLLAQLATNLAACDPAAEVLLNLACPACDHRWQMLFDIAAFFWTELCAEAQRLLREVATLARSYGWREADILALSATRREAYLELWVRGLGMRRHGM